MLNEDTSRTTSRLLYLLKRLSDSWFCNELCHENIEGFNNSYIPVFMSIGTAGISNSKLASNLTITKQAASKVIKELEELGLVCSEKCSTDGRLMMLYLTSKGAAFYGHLKGQIVALEQEYKKVVGAKNYETAIDVMSKLVKYHEELNKMEAV
ncbi:MarR family transcriptional regulator [Mucilaginibacter sp. BJC16-A38]|uniref:MarR family winged helix-turn-helix transcriptional regulator n=1 Tax=Mucilaginibacter phenanthrenivorans TaxID=1234842 RepID=UPI0021584F3D|nr:MarR family transcriptional regulator [Mucilaginibacter phenanthrenivorans]MCR8560876.1 MarR family transcriptional regulator [Mucilaginibacter phenanthrenivorans]